MILNKYPDASVLNEHIAKKDPLIIAIPFDENEPVLLSFLDDSVEHHILLAHFGVNQASTDRYFRIITDAQTAEWTFVCPPDYLGIKDRRKRIARFYNDGFYAVSKVLSEIGYFPDIIIPKRYRRHFDVMSDDGTFML